MPLTSLGLGVSSAYESEELVRGFKLSDTCMAAKESFEEASGLIWGVSSTPKFRGSCVLLHCKSRCAGVDIQDGL